MSAIRFSFVLCRWKIHGAASAAADSKTPRGEGVNK
jgi:hypothetical protein